MAQRRKTLAKRTKDAKIDQRRKQWAKQPEEEKKEKGRPLHPWAQGIFVRLACGGRQVGGLPRAQGAAGHQARAHGEGGELGAGRPKPHVALSVGSIARPIRGACGGGWGLGRGGEWGGGVGGVRGGVGGSGGEWGGYPWISPGGPPVLLIWF